MENLMGLKELYDVVLKATYPIEIGNKVIEEGEVILAFDNIQIAGLSEIKKYVSAQGGFDNRELITWETTKELPLSFSQGIFSKRQLALLSNSKLIELEPNNSSILITNREYCESDENGKITLKQVPVGKTFVYNEETGEKLEYTLSEKEITISEPYVNVYVTYDSEYINGGSIIKIGNRLFRGYLKLQAKTRLKEDTNGRTVTGIFEIPKLKLMSDLSIRLGRTADPAMISFTAAGIPIGGRGASYVCNLYSLNDDIDSDM